MECQSTRRSLLHEFQRNYYSAAILLVDIECELKKASQNKNKELASFAENLLSVIAQAREEKDEPP